MFCDTNKDRMQKQCPQEVDVPTYHFVVHKTICTSSSRVMVLVHSKQMNYVVPFNYCITQWYLSNNLFNNPNGECMETLHPQEFDV